MAYELWIPIRGVFKGIIRLDLIIMRRKRFGQITQRKKRCETRRLWRLELINNSGSDFFKSTYLKDNINWVRQRWMERDGHWSQIRSQVWTRGSLRLHMLWDCDFRISILFTKEDRVFAFPNNSNMSKSGSKHLNCTPHCRVSAAY